jgi:hypothetical protein
MMWMRAPRTMMLGGAAIATLVAPAIAQPATPREQASQEPSVETQRLMLSGRGPADAVPWDFTIDGGRRAGEHTTIPVPSNWQQHGFGAYQYGNDDPERPKNHGRYSRRFTVPAAWQGKRIRLMFDGVMTDAAVMVNGVPAGPVHQGGFYRFGYDITKLVKAQGDNVVVVDVSEASSNPDTNQAERFADYWVFGGIFRPVWLEATPPEAIEHVAVDAQATGAFTADVTLAAPRNVTRVEGRIRDAGGKPVGAPFMTAIPPGGTGRVRLTTRIGNPRLWTAETPDLYDVDVTLYEGDRAVHRTRERFGFRTFEVRPGQGLYLNGQRILLKGVNRHSFRPDTARALTRDDNYDDVRTIRSMNMNAVRMSHYPPDESFLQAADELGLYVLDELSGWQHAHDTQVGRRLVREMIERDVNHPSIILWDNGNEGGFNRELDGDFALYDPQGRKVLHPWELHDGIDTKHYPTYPDLQRRLAGRDLVMPTEFMHALFDGGGGAGLDDYWHAIATSPRGAGGFIWAFADEGIARTDQQNQIDNFGTNAPDGIVGARHEREPSVATVRDIWSPVQIAAPRLDGMFNGRLRVTNGFDFTPLNAVRFEWRLLRFAGPNDAGTNPHIIRRGEASTAILPHATGDLPLDLPRDWRKADALSLSAKRGPDDLWTWVWPVEKTGVPTAPMTLQAAAGRGSEVASVVDGGTVRMTAGGTIARFDAGTGLLRDITRDGVSLALSGGPRLVAIGPASKDEPHWTRTVANGLMFRPPAPTVVNLVEVTSTSAITDGWTGFALDISGDGTTWKTIYDGKRRPRDGDRFVLPPQDVAVVRIRNLRNNFASPVAITAVRLGYEPQRFPAPKTPAVRLRTGTSKDPRTGQDEAWVETDGAGGVDHVRWTLSPTGVLALDYRYTLNGRFLYHGIGFDHVLSNVSSVCGLLEGPTPVWQNRLNGTTLGVHLIAERGSRVVPEPETAGFFRGLRWARFNTPAGGWTVTSATPSFLRIGTRLNDHPNTTSDFPRGDIAFLHAIPAMGSKFIAAEDSGPTGAPAAAAGEYSGRLTFNVVNNSGGTNAQSGCDNAASRASSHMMLRR